MKKSVIVILACLAIAGAAYGQVVEEWVTRYDGPTSDNDHAWAIAVDGTGNVYVTGSSYGSGTEDDVDYATVKYNPSGVQQWVAEYDGTASNRDYAYAIAIDDAGNVYVTGQSEGSGTYFDYATVKYNSSGVKQWAARYAGTVSGWDGAWDIAVDDACNVYVTGSSDGNYATVKYNPSGVQQWVARYDGPANEEDYAYAMTIDDADNVYVTGRSCASETYFDYATVKYNSSGVEQWVARYDAPLSSEDGAYAIAVDGAGNVYVTGESWGLETFGDYATVKYSSSGDQEWVARYDGPASDWDYDYARAIAIDDAGNIYVTGESGGSGTGLDYATIKYSQGPSVAEAPEPSPLHLTTSLNRLSYDIPGGVTGETRLILYSADGRRILEETIKGKGTWVAPIGFPSGVYFVRVEGGRSACTGKIVLVR